jgi:hypothetical protein
VVQDLMQFPGVRPEMDNRILRFLSLAAETIFMALVTCRVVFMEEILVRISLSPDMLLFIAKLKLVPIK